MKIIAHMGKAVEGTMVWGLRLKDFIIMEGLGFRDFILM